MRLMVLLLRKGVFCAWLQSKLLRAEAETECWSHLDSHIDRLDDALIRPGRIDVRIHFGHATRRQAHELFTKFYPNLPQDSDLPSLFASKIPENAFSMAHLQGFLMGHKQRPSEAVKLVDEWIESHQKGKADDSTESGSGAVEDL